MIWNKRSPSHKFISLQTFKDQKKLTLKYIIGGSPSLINFLNSASLPNFIELYRKWYVNKATLTVDKPAVQYTKHDNFFSESQTVTRKHYMKYNLNAPKLFHMHKSVSKTMFPCFQTARLFVNVKIMTSGTTIVENLENVVQFTQKNPSMMLYGTLLNPV